VTVIPSGFSCSFYGAVSHRSRKASGSPRAGDDIEKDASHGADQFGDLGKT